MTPGSESHRPETPSSPSPDTPRRPLPFPPPSSLPLATRRPTKSSRAAPHTTTTAIKSSLEPVMEGDGRLMRDIHSPPPGDVRRLGRKASGPELSKQRSQYFEDAFRSKHASDEMEATAANPSIILAEVRTNVFIADEFNFITDLAHHLATRYSHPASHVAISVQHGACLHFGGSFDPAYTVAVHAPPALLQPATNRRNVALLQVHLEEALRVGPARGFVRFVAVPEECSGWKGNTVAGQRERTQERERERDRERDREGGEANESESPGARKRAMRSLSIKRSKAAETKLESQRGNDQETSRSIAAVQATGEKPGTGGAGDAGEMPGRGLRKKKSFIHSLFGRTSREESQP